MDQGPGTEVTLLGLNLHFFPVCMHGHTLYACVIYTTALVCMSGCKHSGETTLADQHQPLL